MDTKNNQDKKVGQHVQDAAWQLGRAVRRMSASVKRVVHKLTTMANDGINSRSLFGASASKIPPHSEQAGRWAMRKMLLQMGAAWILSWMWSGTQLA